MADIVNLRRARKEKMRSAASETAAVNRLRSSESRKLQRQRAEQMEKNERQLDGHLIDRDRQS